MEKVIIDEKKYQEIKKILNKKNDWFNLEEMNYIIDNLVKK